MYITALLRSDMRKFSSSMHHSPINGIHCKQRVKVRVYRIPVASGTATRFANKKYGALYPKWYSETGNVAIWQQTEMAMLHHNQ